MPSSTCRKLRGRKSSEEYSVELAGSSHIRDASICAILLIRLNSGLVVFRFLSFYTSRSKADYGSDRFWRAPWKGGAFQWVQAPPGNRSSRKQSEQSWR